MSLMRYGVAETARRRFLQECLGWGGVVPLGYLSVTCDASSPKSREGVVIEEDDKVAKTAWLLRNSVSELIGFGVNSHSDYYENNSLHECNAIADAADETLKIFRVSVKLVVENDSSSSVEFVKSGRRKEEHKDASASFNQALERFCVLKSDFADLRVRWIPRNQNEAADYLAGLTKTNLPDLVQTLARSLAKTRLNSLFFPRYWSSSVTEARESGTCPGQKKTLSYKLRDEYSPANVEQMWYDWWKESRYFEADSNSPKLVFSVVHPPPNLTGALDIGHALSISIEDTLVRWRRMSGYNTLFVPGTDHGGGAVEAVVEEMLSCDRHHLGEEEFLRELWNWKDKNIDKISKQSCRIGASFDWSREYFTMDEMRSKAVIEAFVRLFDMGIIHRGDSVCSRSMLKPQWYVDCSRMADEGNRKIEIFPKQYEAELKRWFENSQDRCISRQALWGHRVPAWYVTLKEDKLKELGAYSDHWVVCRSFEDAQAEAKRRYNGKEYMIAQDPDVLDTWFSSAIIPLSVLGWPNKTDDLKVFYPTSLIVTGHDTLFSWVAPMIMLCSKLGGDVPFRKLFLHHLINDKFGQKLSNASGNIVDPLDFIAGLSHDNLRKKLMDDGVPERDIKGLFRSEILPFGADCLRFGLVQSTHEVDINFDTRDFISGYRGSCLVLWKGARLALNIIGDNYVPPTEIDFNVMPFSCQWILCVLNMTIKKTGVLLESFELGQAIKTLKSWWVDFDSFVGLIRHYGVRDSDRATLWVCLDVGLRLFHPFMPFVTEELWQRLPHTRDTPESIMISEYPRPVQSWANERVEREMVVVCAISEFIKSNLSLLSSKEVFLFSCDEGKLEIIRGRQKDIEVFSKFSGIKVLNDINDVPPKHRAHRVTKDLFIYTWNSY